MDGNEKHLLVDEVVSSWLKSGCIQTGMAKEDMIETVLASMERMTRHNGTLRHVHSVLEHSLFTGLMAESIAGGRGLGDTAKLMGLLHDVGEVIVGDFVKPMKTGEPFGMVYQCYFEPLETAFRSYFGKEVLGMEDFDEKWKLVERPVLLADQLGGRLDLEYEDPDFLDSDEITEADSIYLGVLRCGDCKGKFRSELESLSKKLIQQ